ncbi:low-density lipoprotein receptor-related protein 1B-like isoform X2 [Mercenaria mercenaria]|uniref:low-density lipoprotein receptor-related protein 1B-like isoform X2 n=1 Tax=Mercenaria mercenaria TaxID=6596 RepID=UPI00234F8610|nr:low-density lipoprotein receptor-related protein 1B-like isoform X2 [Mercenaria mercenaria]
MASTLVVVSFLAILLLDIKCVFGNTCDCETVKDILTDEIFDLKAENKQLESRIKKMELMMQTKTSVSYQAAEIDKDWIQRMETRINDIESKIPESTKVSRNPFKPQSLIAKALRSEKKERLKSKLKIAAGLKKINNSLKAFNVQSDAVFASHISNISDRIQDIKTELSQNMSHVRNEVMDVSNRTAKLANQTSSLIENKITTIEMSIDAMNHDVSQIDADLNTIIDIVLLDQKAECEPNCTNGGVCFKDNTCRCKPFTEGPNCEKIICEDKCYENGGKCVGSGKCECQENRYGHNLLLCEADELKCVVDKKCLTADKICNRLLDCSDGRDEKSCDLSMCRRDQFQCSSGMCIHNSWRCDGDSDCGDGSDETNCHLSVCRHDQFQCSSGMMCIYNSWRCDGYSDCDDGSDETNCR